MSDRKLAVVLRHRRRRGVAQPHQWCAFGGPEPDQDRDTGHLSPGLSPQRAPVVLFEN